MPVPLSHAMPTASGTSTSRIATPQIAEQARQDDWDYFEAVRQGVFCELGQGAVDFRGIVADLREMGYAGWIVVEQDVLPGLGTPAASAARNRAFIRTLGL